MPYHHRNYNIFISQNFQQVLYKFYQFRFFFNFFLKMWEFTLKIIDWTKFQNCFSNIPQKCVCAQEGPFDIRFEMRKTPTMEAFDFWRNQAKSWFNFSKTLKNISLMVVVILFWTLTSIGPFCVRDHFLEIIESWDIWKTNSDFFSKSLIFNVNSHIFKLKGQKQTEKVKIVQIVQTFLKFLGLIYRNVIVSAKIGHIF